MKIPQNGRRSQTELLHVITVTAIKPTRLLLRRRIIVAVTSERMRGRERERWWLWWWWERERTRTRKINRRRIEMTLHSTVCAVPRLSVDFLRSKLFNATNPWCTKNGERHWAVPLMSWQFFFFIYFLLLFCLFFFSSNWCCLHFFYFCCAVTSQ